MTRLEKAVASLQSRTQNPVDLKRFETDLRLLYRPGGRGWKVEKLSFFQYLYYFFFSPFGASLAEENRTLLKEKVSVLKREMKDGKLGTNAQALVDLFGITFGEQPKTPLLESGDSVPSTPSYSPPTISLPAPTSHAPSFHKKTPIATTLDPSIEQGLFVPSCQIKGISNVGNSCWLNSCCQVLFRLQPFIEALNQEPAKCRNPLTGKEEDPVSFANRKAVCIALKSVYLEYIKNSSTASSRGQAVNNLRAVLFASYKFPGGVTRQHDSQEGMDALLNAVMPEVKPALPVISSKTFEEDLSNVFTQENIWVRLSTQLAQVIEPKYRKEREVVTNALDPFYFALQHGKGKIIPDLENAANQPFPGESDDAFALRKKAVDALQALYRELLIQNGIKKEGVENEKFNLSTLRPLVADVEETFSAVHPGIKFEPNHYKNIFEIALNILLPPEIRGEILAKQISSANLYLEKRGLPPLSPDYIAEYSLGSDFTPNTLFTISENSPPFICFNVYRENEKEVPLEIDLASLTLEKTEAKYALVGITHHWGETYGGHYIATLNEGGKAKIADDDSFVWNAPGFSSKKGYIVYRRIN